MRIHSYEGVKVMKVLISLVTLIKQSDNQITIWDFASIMEKFKLIAKSIVVKDLFCQNCIDTSQDFPS